MSELLSGMCGVEKAKRATVDTTVPTMPKTSMITAKWTSLRSRRSMYTFAWVQCVFALTSLF